MVCRDEGNRGVFPGRTYAFRLLLAGPLKLVFEYTKREYGLLGWFLSKRRSLVPEIDEVLRGGAEVNSVDAVLAATLSEQGNAPQTMHQC